jgi:hypothetical protein
MSSSRAAWNQRDHRLVVRGVKEIFADAIERIWIKKYSKKEKTDGIPGYLIY